MSERALLAGELGSRHGAAAVLLCDQSNRRWVGHGSGEEGEVLLLSSGLVRILAGEELADLTTTLGGLGIHPGALLACDRRPAALVGYPCLELGDELAAARMRKAPEELELIAAAAALADAGQAAVRESAAAGVSETELWAAGQEAMAAAGGDLQALCDLLSGERSALIDGGPGPRALAGGDAVLFDLAPRFGGYWADSCATFVLGRPSAALRACHDTVRAALEAGIAAARPGASAGAVDAAVRDRLQAGGLRCPHHSGHGVGLAPQEPPFLVPGEQTPLAEGMVIAIETGAYGEGFGVRLEHLLAIEADGARPLTTHSLNLTD
ncbi:MAG TPA: M24 family metallopeptidase [Solirubrobacterales bacterium]|nr:M24 family metallopeptidase [Solirubrobacterales bacterium]